MAHHGDAIGLGDEEMIGLGVAGLGAAMIAAGGGGSSDDDTPGTDPGTDPGTTPDATPAMTAQGAGSTATGADALADTGGAPALGLAAVAALLALVGAGLLRRSRLTA